MECPETIYQNWIYKIWKKNPDGLTFIEWVNKHDDWIREFYFKGFINFKKINKNGMVNR